MRFLYVEEIIPRIPADAQASKRVITVGIRERPRLPLVDGLSRASNAGIPGFETERKRWRAGPEAEVVTLGILELRVGIDAAHLLPARRPGVPVEAV